MPPQKKYDMKPQLFRLPALQESAAATYTQVFKTTPTISSLGNGRSQVMEIFRFLYRVTPPPLQDTDENSIRFHIADRTFPDVQEYDVAGVFISDSKYTQVMDSAATDGTVAAYLGEGLKVVDVSDGAGNGLIYGGPAIYMGIKGDSSNLSTSVIHAVVLFKLAHVSAMEYAQTLQFQ